MLPRYRVPAALGLQRGATEGRTVGGMTREVRKYAELEGAYSVTWTKARDRYHAALRGNPREVYGGAIGNFTTLAAAWEACAEHAANEGRKA